MNKVRILPRLIPDGIRFDKDGKALAYRFSLALMPDVRVDRSGEDVSKGVEVDLENWPRDVGAHLADPDRNFKLYAALAPGAPKDQVKELVWYPRGGAHSGPHDGKEAREFSAARATSANKLWRRLFLADCKSNDGKLYEQFSALLVALKETQAVRGSSGPVSFNIGPDPELVTYPVADLADLFEGLYGAHFLASLLKRGFLKFDLSPSAPAVRWEETRPIIGPAFFEAANRDLIGLFLPDTQANRLGVETGSIKINKEGSHPELVQAISRALEADVSNAGQSAYLSREFVKSLKSYLKNEAEENQKFADYWNAFHDSFDTMGRPDPNTLPRRARAAGYEDFFEAMASCLVPWSRGQLPGIAENVTPQDPVKAAAVARARAQIHTDVAAYHAAWRPDSGVAIAGPGDKCKAEPDKEIARRKFINILGRPSLAKFLGFMVDVEVKVADLHDALGDLKAGFFKNSYFYLMADFGKGTDGGSEAAIDRPKARLWTATLLAREAKDKPVVFGPCSKDTFGNAIVKGLLSDEASALPTLPEDHGAWNLASGDRFALVDFDIDAALHAFENAAQDRSTSVAKGALTENVSTVLPNLRTRGLALIDRDRKTALTAEKSSAEKMDPDVPQVFYSEELVIGYRIDIGVCNKGKFDLPGDKRWRSLNERIVTYDPHDVPNSYRPWLQADKDREDGFAKPITRQIENDGKQQWLAQQTVVVWTGASLAVESEHDPNDLKQPHDGEKFSYQPMDPVCQLGTDLTFALPQDAMNALPPLRFGRGYWMGGRLTYLNGGSLSLPEVAARHYAIAPDKTTAVGDSRTKAGHVFSRGERAGAPAILIPPDDVLAHKPPGELHGETAGTAVLRGSDARVRRYLVPARTTFDIAEAHGQFDKITNQAVPRGAFNQYDRDPREGEFPHARPEPGKGKPRNNPALVLKSGNSVKDPPYYPDPLARECGVKLLQHGVGPLEKKEDEAAPPCRLAFYTSDDLTIEHARPVLIEVRSFDPAPGAPRYHVSEDKHQGLTRLIVKLAQAIDLDLVLWTPQRDDQTLLTMRAARYGWSLFRKKSKSPEFRSDLAAFASGSKEPMKAFIEAVDHISNVSGELSAAYLAGSKILVNALDEQCEPPPNLSDKRTLRVVRPVKRPLAAPRIDRMVPVRIKIETQTKPGDPPKVLQRWSDYVARQGGMDELLFPSELDGNATFFVGDILAQRASTGKVRFRAVWNDFNDNVVKGEQDGRTVFRHQTTPGQAEFSTQFARDMTAELSKVDLLRDDAGELRGLKIDFDDNKARLVKFGLHGVSRFVEFYPPTDPKKAAEAAKSAEFEEYDVKHDSALWIPSTTRPAQPVVDRILPVFTWSRRDYKHDNIRVILYRRNVALRVFLKRPWHSSGQGELLGVVCWPPDIFDGADSVGQDKVAADMAACTLLDRQAPAIVDPKSEFLSRWGADPVHLSGELPELIPLREFRFAFRRVGHLQLPIHGEYPTGTPMLDVELGCPNDPPAGQTPAPANMVEVAIAAYYPVLEPDRGENWYCDVPLDPGKSYFPFVRLGLARYQEHALKGLELSYPVAEWAQIPPRREARVELLNEHDILVVVEGTGYHETNDYELPADQKGKLNKTRFCLRVCRMTQPDSVPHNGDEINWLPVISAGQKLESSISAETEQIYIHHKFHLPHSWRHHRYAVIIEEFEPMVADGEIIGDKIIRCRGPMFACTIPLLIGGDGPGAAGGILENDVRLEPASEV